jgi:hypothetical protein
VGTTLDHIESGCFRLPPFQRSWCWSDEHILRLLDSLQRSYHVGTIIAWERFRLPASQERFGDHVVMAPAGCGHLVIDGQQRLGAIATAAHSGRFWFDLESGAFVIGHDGPWRLPASMALSWRRSVAAIDWYRVHAEMYGLDIDRVFDLMCAGAALMDWAEISVVTLPAKWEMGDVVEMFRRLNTSGVRVTDDELEAGLRACEGAR